MSRFVYTEAAELDFAELVGQTRRQFGEVRALALTLKLIAAVERLALRPLLGHARPDFGQANGRIWTARPFVIVYQTGVGPLRILRILHGARDIAALLDPPAE